MKTWLQKFDKNGFVIGIAVSVVAGLVTCWLAVMFALRVPIDFNAAYEIAVAKCLGRHSPTNKLRSQRRL